MNLTGKMGRRWAAVYICIALLTAVLSIFPASDPDLFIMLATGRQIAETGQIPHADTWSHTAAGRPWQMHEWLSSLVTYGVFSLLGINGIILLKALALAAIFLAGAMLARFLGSSPLATLWIAVAAVLAAQLGFAERMQVFTFAGLMAVQVLWALFRAGRIRVRTWLASLAGLFALWANLHAGLLLGLAMLFFYGLEGVWAFFKGKSKELLWGSWAGTIVAAAAANVNPYGFKVWQEILKYFYEPASIRFAEVTGAAISEYQPLFAAGWQYKPQAVFSLVWITLSALSMSMAWRRTKPGNILSWLLLLWFAYWSARYIPMLVLVSLPAAAAGWSLAAGAALGKLGGRFVTDKARATASAASFATAGALALYLATAGWHSSGGAWTRMGLGWRHGGYSGQAADFIRENLGTARVFNSYRLGGFLAWRRVPVFIDGRLSMYPKVFEDYLAISIGDTSRLSGYRVDCLAVEYPRQSGWAKAHLMISQDPGWALVFWDDAMLVYVRRKPEYAGLISANEYRYLDPAFPDLEIRPELFLSELARREAADSCLLTTRLLGYQYHFRHGNLDSAERFIMEGLRCDPHYGPFHNNLGNIYLARGMAVAAIRSYERAVHLDKGLSLAWGNLGLVYERKGDKAKAVKCYLRNAIVAPLDPWPYNRLGEIAYQNGDLKNAVKYWKKGAEIDPNSKAAENLKRINR